MPGPVLHTKRRIRVTRLQFWIEIDPEGAINDSLVDDAHAAGAVARACFNKLDCSWVQENFGVLCLNARGRVCGFVLVGVGSLTSTIVHAREVFAPAMELRAAHIILVHNHPSGDCTPSPEDVELTERLTSAGRLLGIPVVDHVIIDGTGVVVSIGVADPDTESVRVRSGG